MPSLPKGISWSDFKTIKCDACLSEKFVTPTEFSDFLASHASCTKSDKRSRIQVASQVLAALMSDRSFILAPSQAAEMAFRYADALLEAAQGEDVAPTGENLISTLPVGGIRSPLA